MWQQRNPVPPWEFRNDLPELKEYARRHDIPKTILPQHVIWEAYHYMYLGVSRVVENICQSRNGMRVARIQRDGLLQFGDGLRDFALIGE